MKKILFILTMVSMMVSCAPEQKTEPINVTPEDLHGSVDKVTEIMIHDIFSPPVASRIFAYPNVAAYEIIALKDDRYSSLAGQVHELTPIPRPDSTQSINHELSALVAHMELSKRLIFSEDRMEAYRDSLYRIYEERNPVVFNASKDYGLRVADHIGEWMN
ncbi:MAG: phosphatidic acid phosphatase, partial [Pricia sp.]